MITLKCIDPSQVNDIDYMAYLDGDERPEFTEHLKKCEFCRNEVAEYAAYSVKLHQQLKPIKAALRANCPNTQTLGEYVLDLLKKPARQELEQHLASCEYCSHEYAQLNGWLVEPQTAKATSLLKRVIATVSSVARPMSLQLGLRGTARPVPQTYEANGVIINVAVQSAGAAKQDLQVVGQLLSDDENAELDIDGAEARIISSGQILATETVDEMGSFFFNQVKSAGFDLEIQLKDCIIIVPNLHQ